MCPPHPNLGGGDRGGECAPHSIPPLFFDRKTYLRSCYAPSPLSIRSLSAASSLHLSTPQHPIRSPSSPSPLPLRSPSAPRPLPLRSPFASPQSSSVSLSSPLSFSEPLRFP